VLKMVHMNKEQKKLAILAEMAKGGRASEVGEKYNVSPLTIGSWMKAQRKEHEKESVAELTHVDPIVLEAVTQEIKDKASNSSTITTKQLDRLDVQLDNIKEGVVGVKLLETEFHTTMMNLLKWANKKITDDMKVSEWTQLVSGISSLHSTLFSKGSNTQINLMQQNNGGNGSSAKVEKFKGGFRT